ncbi:hypothetical protein HNP48_005923 [Acidovorax soli]|uniref:Lipoprotein n=1 Tax=Acidovorax soli TaxID=592050 RepID=A0A7X0UCP2_9BURK|nr:hypothetical protein [Acidovorax soli]MBB6563204.1 hypothetical protein [Acidovorax soli]
MLPKTDGRGRVNLLVGCALAWALVALPACAVTKEERQACEGYRDLVMDVARKADAGVTEQQMKRLLAAQPDLLPMVEIIYEQKARRSNRNIAAWHFAACMGDARERRSAR